MIRKISKYILVITLLGLILWDIFAFIKEENSTFSVILTDLYYEHPLWAIIICVSVGALLGHWFAPAKGSKD